MSHPRDKGERQFVRFTKAMRRIHEDRAEHGSDHSCPCFGADGKGRVFARFADYPAVCSCTMCGSPRRHFGKRTIQERRAVA